MSLRYWVYRHSFSGKDRRAFYEQLAFMLDSNKSVARAFSEMRAIVTDFGRKDDPLAYLLTDCLNAISGHGGTLESTLAEWIPEQEAALISAGYQTGRIAESLRNAITLIEGKKRIISTVVGACLYPLILLSVAVGMLNIVAQRLVPELSKISPTANWHGPVSFLATSAMIISQHGVTIAVVLAILLVAVFISLPYWTGRLRSYADNLPPWSVYRTLQGTVFLLNMASLLKANISTLNAIRLLNRFSSAWMKERLEATENQIQQGEHLGKALKGTGLNFPSRECVTQLYVLTDSDGYEDIVERYAKNWLELTIAGIERWAKILSILAILTNVGFILTILMAIQQIQSMVLINM
ncbi:pilus assembly protein PilR [Lelliottia aquatilis]|uniref:type II secretion system F family protein n=1 Tax=Lelliottia aquatilis TaxID=2080838 RepID=UPI0015761FBA|nr:type II secretion system F family protein [Lelliottia aquatilis]NTZ47722.1 pilus assembly protein PilR [Lelliottia aquatilis]